MSFDLDVVSRINGLDRRVRRLELVEIVPTSGSRSGAPNGAQYVTMALDGTLTDERVLDAGSGLSLTDQGANASVVMDVLAGPGLGFLSGSVFAVASDISASLVEATIAGSLNDNYGPASGTYVTLSVTGDLTSERVLQAGSGLLLTDQGAGASVFMDVDAGSGLEFDGNQLELAAHPHTSGSITDFDEAAQDAVGGIFTDTGSVEFTYADVTPSISASVNPGGVSHDGLADVSADDHHTGFIGLEDNAASVISPAADDRIQITDDGKVNADAVGNTLALSIDESQLSSIAAPGADTEIVVNTAGVLGTDSNFTYDDATGIMSILGDGGSLVITQDAVAGAVPSLTLRQDDVSEPLISISSDAGDQDLVLMKLTGITGTPTLGWDESEDALSSTHQLIIPTIKGENGTNFQLSNFDENIFIDIKNTGSRFSFQHTTDDVRLVLSSQVNNKNAEIILSETDSQNVGAACWYDGSGNKFHISVNNGGGDIITVGIKSLTVIRDTGLVGINQVTPTAQLHVDQSSLTGAIPVLLLDQADVSDEFINFTISGDQDMVLMKLSVTGNPAINWDESEDSFSLSKGLDVTGSMDATTVTGANVTSGADPGHTHTGASLGGIDISDDTNLAVSSPITLTGDTIGFDFSTNNTWTGTNEFDNDVILDSTVTVDHADGINYAPGGDGDAAIATVLVTGNPVFKWDESEDNFSFDKGIITTELGIGTAAAPDELLHVKGASDPIIWLEDTGSAIGAITRTMAGIQLSAGTHELEAGIGPGIKFMSTDAQLTTETPKLGAVIVGQATETYNADTSGGMSIGFYVTDNAPGANNVPVQAMNLRGNGRLGVTNGSLSFSAIGDFVQDSTTEAIPVLSLKQDDVSEEFIFFQGSAAAATLTQSIVAEADVTTATSAGFFKVEVQDDGNQIADQAYFVRVWTLA